MYKAYNKLYKNGKPVGRKYVAAVATQKSTLKNQITKSNATWNKFQKKKKSNWTTKTVEIKKAKR